MAEKKDIETTTFHNRDYKTFVPSLTVDSFDISDNARVFKFEKADGYSVFRWPEFQAFARRLGLDLGSPVKTILIKVPHDDMVSVVVESLGLDLKTPLTK